MQRDPRDPETFERLGELDAMLGMFPEATLNFTNALRLNPFSASTHARLGGLLASQQSFAGALGEVREAERFMVSGDVLTEQALCAAYSRLRRLPSAMSHCERLLQTLKERGFNPGSIAFFETALQGWRARLTAVYVTNSIPTERSERTLATVLRERHLGETEIRLLSNPLACTPGMNLCAHQLTEGATNNLQKAELLFEAIAPHAGSRRRQRLTAREAFDIWKLPSGQFDCFASSCLYVSMARSLGLQSQVVSVTETCEGTKNPHACAAVWLTNGNQMLLVDPNLLWFGARHKAFVVLDDVQTLALHICTLPGLVGPQVACKLAPELSVVQANLLQALIDNGQWSRARERLPLLLRADGNSWISDTFKADFALHEGRPDDAITLLQKAIKANPDSGEAYGQLGNVFVTRGDLTRARESYENVLRCVVPEESAAQARQAIGQIDKILKVPAGSELNRSN
jgi:tetratricopeptide (TPR) repeat protein